MAADGRRHVIAIGGGMRVPDGQVPAHMDYALRLAGRPEARICVLNTAGGDDPRWALHMYDRFAGHLARLSHLALFPMPNVADPEDLLLSQDVIFVGGGSVANMLAVWRVHGLDRILRKAWQAGIVLAGSSAGGICWFEGGTTDSFGRELRAITDGRELLPALRFRAGTAAAVPPADRGRDAGGRHRLRRRRGGALHRRRADRAARGPARRECVPGGTRRHGDPPRDPLPRLARPGFLYPGVEAMFYPWPDAPAGPEPARWCHERATGSDRARSTQVVRDQDGGGRAGPRRPRRRDRRPARRQRRRQDDNRGVHPGPAQARRRAAAGAG